MKAKSQWLIENRWRDEKEYSFCGRSRKRKFAIKLADDLSKQFPKLKFRVIEQTRQVVKIFR